ncbi:helix-turn-helix domain-containing protein [Brachybacterium sp. FME24]|uniref:helix-turn-helix domain-containing protein n=1 Tax=Brachybacterium sp. FME24 TaxID=2742605 RepID=UPI001866ED0D|nr:helix-turn-helix domain-containing protein [Brachybacterium sp. FME24]
MGSQPSTAALLAQLEALEARVRDLETAAADATSSPPSDTEAPSTSATSSAPAGPPTTSTPSDPFWALTSLKEQVGDPGAVLFAGSVEVGLGHVEYQWARPTEYLLATDWADRAESVAALGHPLRLAILRRLLDGEHTVAQIVDELELGSTGVAYHHLSALQTGGWVTSPRRGSWSIPASRVIPLLTIVTALEDS